MIAEKKAQLRTELQNALRTFGVSARHQASTRIQQNLFRSELWKNHEVFLLFSALPGEPRTVEILKQAVEEGKTCLYPKVDPMKLKMDLYHVKSTQRLIRGSFGILEPATDRCDPKEFREVEVALVPGLGFDATGQRLGRGYGYYDRFLGGNDFKGITIGCHFECQLVDEIPVESHDRSVDYLLNEKGLNKAAPSGADEAE